MTKRVMLVVWCLLTAAAAAHAQPSPNAPLNLDHFKCYFVQGQPVQPRTVVLEDQFDRARNQRETIEDLRVVRLCNPVEKTIGRGPKARVTPILHPEDHLTLYRIDPEPIIPRRVWIRNQFGRQRLSVRDAQVLAVPTGKTKDPTGGTGTLPLIPQDLDHFKCYAAGGKRINKVARLKDQFHGEVVWVLEPLGFCNPVQKTVQSSAGVTETTEIKHPDAHLACYTITPRPFQTSVLIANQFVPTGSFLSVREADILCVPSLKLKWAYVLPPTAADVATP